MRLTIVQYAGDYREAFNRFRLGGKQTYQAQRYSVDLVSEISRRVEELTVICALTEEAYDDILPNGVRVIGGGFKQGFRLALFADLLDRASPTCLWVSTPIPSVLNWALQRKIPTIAVLADSFNTTGVKAWIKKKRIAGMLNKPTIRWVANHGLGACLSLQNIGVNPEKIIPWDWPASSEPSDFSTRERRSIGPFTVLYVGSVSEAKGVGDLLKAATRFNNPRGNVQFRVVGMDAAGAMQKHSDRLDLSKIVTFAGLVPNEDIVSEMRRADIVVVPSRHEYPEGMPLTIYEALSARTPIVASDHPMFRRALIDRETAVIFKAGNSEHLAHEIRMLLSDPALYKRLSTNSVDAWNRLQLPVTWGALLKAWIASDSDSEDWLYKHRLDSGIYDF